MSAAKNIFLYGLLDNHINPLVDGLHSLKPGGFCLSLMVISYTTILHEFRKENGLSCVEYVLCDLVQKLSNNPSSQVPGWCFMSKENIAEELGLTKQAVLNMIDRLVERGFLQKNPQTRYLKPTEKWAKLDFTGGKETLPEQGLFGKETLPTGGKETLPNNSSSNNIDILRKAKIEFCRNVIEFVKLHPNLYPKLMYVEFVEYWVETNKRLNRLRYQEEKYFDIGRRLATWVKNCKSLSEYREQENKLPALNDLLKTKLSLHGSNKPKQEEQPAKN